MVEPSSGTDTAQKQEQPACLRLLALDEALDVLEVLDAVTGPRVREDVLVAVGAVLRPLVLVQDDVKDGGAHRPVIRRLHHDAVLRAHIVCVVLSDSLALGPSPSQSVSCVNACLPACVLKRGPTCRVAVTCWANVADIRLWLHRAEFRWVCSHSQRHAGAMACDTSAA